MTDPLYPSSKVWHIKNPILEIQVQERVGEFQARTPMDRNCTVRNVLVGIV